MTKSTKKITLNVVKGASKVTFGGNGKATEFGRPQGRKPGSK